MVIIFYDFAPTIINAHHKLSFGEAQHNHNTISGEYSSGHMSITWDRFDCLSKALKLIYQLKSNEAES